MAKSPEAFRTISEVADWLGVQAHVLRFWESKFTHVKPVKRAGGRRYYRPADMLLLGGIKKLLYDDGMTIKGVQKTLREQGASYVADHSPALDDLTMAQLDDEVAAVAPQSKPTDSPVEGPTIQEIPSEAAVPESPADTVAPGASVEQNTAVEVSAAEPIANDTPVAEEVASPQDMPQAETEVATPEVTRAKQEAVEQEGPVEEAPEPGAEHEPVTEPVLEQESAPEPELEFISESEQEPEAEPDTRNTVPAFMHRGSDEIPAPTAKAPLIVDAPDAPPEDQIEVPPGLLARLSTLNSIPASQIDKMRAAKTQLETLHARLSGSGKE